MERVHVFLALFTVVLFLESAGSRYIISAVQSMERQFHIPSRISGILVSADELGYIPTVILISYLGGKGNRAKWCGAGAILMSLALIFTASPNFLYPQEQPRLNMSKITTTLRPSEALLSENASLEQYFSFQPIKDRIPMHIRDLILAKIHGLNAKFDQNASVIKILEEEEKLKLENGHSYSLDEPLMYEALIHMKNILQDSEDQHKLLETLQKFAENRQQNTRADLKVIRRAAIAPFSFCNRLVNDLRAVIKHLKCTEQPSNFGPLLIIFFALLFMGIGRTAPWSLGIPLLDDNVKKRSMPLYFACISFIRILGPITGFLIGSLANKLYFSPPAPPGLTPSDPTWIGAWWLGFLIIGLANILPSVFLFFFPAGKSDLKDPKNDLKKKSSFKKSSLKLFDKHIDRRKPVEAHEKNTGFKKFLKSYEEVFKSKLYIGAVMGRILDVLAFKGYITYMPKFLENHYGIPQYKVHLYMAAFGTFGFALGVISGGIVTRKFKLNGRKVALFVLFVSIINIILFSSKLVLGCESIVNSVGTEGVPTNFNYTQSCNAECGCSHARLFPVCDPTGQVYYSPCHAGCRHVSIIDIQHYKMEFSDCDCAPGKIVKKEFCRDNCFVMMVLYFATGLIAAFAGGMGVVPGLLILLRSVPPATRSISLGLHGFLVSLIGTLPSPILWGAIIDSACLLWEETCSSNVASLKGACSIYEPNKLRIRIHLLYVVLRTLSLIADVYVWYYAKNLNILDEEKEEEEGQNHSDSEITQRTDDHIPMKNVNAQFFD